MHSVELLLAALLIATPAAAQTAYEGKAAVVDGDTIEVEGVRFRLEGVHAPERSDPGGPAATRFMADLLRDRTVSCEPTGDRSYDRLIAVCRIEPAGDIGAALIRAGLGRDCTRYSRGRYSALETAKGKALPLPGYCRP